MIRSFLTCSFAVVLTIPVAQGAEVSRREANQLAVDVLTLRLGGDVRGVILKRTPVQIEIAVRRDWLAKHQPALLEATKPVDASTPRYRELVERIDAWLEDLGAGADADRAERVPYSPKPEAVTDATQHVNADLIRVIKAERATYQEYLDDPLKLPPGEGTTPERQQAYRKLIAKLDTWLAELEAPPGVAAAGADSAQQDEQRRQELIRILQKERETYAQRMQAPQKADDPEFVRLTLSRADVGLIFAQSDARRQLAAAAFAQELDEVESTGIPQLQQLLKEAGVDWQTSTADAAALVENMPPQSDREWAARRAIYEYQFLDRLDFQGTGNFIAQTGEEAPQPNMGELIQGVMDQQMSLALGDLLEEPVFTGLDFGGLGGKPQPGQDWLSKATRIAERKGVRGFRVTRVTPDIQRRRTLVEDRFVAKMPGGNWETIWQVNETQRAGQANSSDLDRIKQDPQLKEVLGLVEGLGLGQGNLDVALQFGAATMNAQQATDDQFYEFRNRYSQKLDGPPLAWDGKRSSEASAPTPARSASE